MPSSNCYANKSNQLCWLVADFFVLVKGKVQLVIGIITSDNELEKKKKEKTKKEKRWGPNKTARKV